MTNLSTELARLHADLRNSVGNIGGYIDAITALNRKLQANLPTIIAALKAAETPLPDDVAGLVERLRATDWGPNVADTLTDWDNARREAADAITALTRQLAEAQQHAEAMADVLEEVAGELEAEVEAKRGSVLPRTTERDLLASVLPAPHSQLTGV
jgi:septation ring formation regulator EzrA